ncbi:MAG: ATP-binding cassette domain-containing protein [Proteobacteria bacterium]|nr:ATP-binding cassette domain-containing protein [Pseudomonadota bacterium]
MIPPAAAAVNKNGPLLRVERLVKHFPVRRGLFGRRIGSIKAVDDISFDVAAGETLAVVGESGCGKSTTGRLVLRLLTATSGNVWFEGRDIFALHENEMRALRREMQIIFQDPYSSLNPRMTVRDMLAEPLALHGLATGRARDERVHELLSLVGLSPYHARRYPHEFSGGQRQRIGIARSIQAQVINLLQDLQRRFNLSYVFIAHDLAVVKHIADRVAVMYLGKIVEYADKRKLFAEPRHPYTQALLSAIPIPDPTIKRQRMILQGDVPSPLNPPSGCRFQTRCPHARERCRTEEPLAESDGAGHKIACHFWREIAPPPKLASGSTERPEDERLSRLQSFFIRREEKAAASATATSN